MKSTIFMAAHIGKWKMLLTPSQIPGQTPKLTNDVVSSVFFFFLSFSLKRRRFLIYSYILWGSFNLVVVTSVLANTGLTGLVSLNVSNSQITSAGLRHLKPLKNLRSLTLESCKVTANDIKRLQSRDLPNLVSFRHE
ncbi:hypothetical protein WN944_016587 [Citrus x changshan-huyou]|uniref:Uncharacterized protein n=1 Tax=Citrus x changshan-huyou TaxID=2935761 RepID=A0AAP0MEN1_9ROSI